MKRTRIVSRHFEMLMGIIGSVIGIFSGSFLIFLEHLGQAHTPFLGVVAIIVSSYYVTKNEEIAGIGFIIATMFVIVGSEYINVLSAIFLLVAGISSLFRK